MSEGCRVILIAALMLVIALGMVAWPLIGDFVSP